MADLASPRHVRYMQQTVDAFLQFDERTVVRQIADLASDSTFHRVLVHDLIPRIVLCLFHTERELLAGLVDTEDNNLDLVTYLQQFVRMVDPFRPRHLADVNETFDTWFEFDEHSIAHHVDNGTGVLLIDVIPFVHGIPRIGALLLQAERDFLLFAIDIQDHCLDLLIDLHHFGRMSDALPAHVGNV